MNVSGRLLDGSGNPVAPGTRNFGFKIFNAQAGGTEVWPGETLSIDVEVGGLWSALVGSTVALTETVFTPDSSRWLQITVSGGGGPTEVLPRTKLVTVPYAYQAANADQVGNMTIAQLNDQYVDYDGDIMIGELSFDFNNDGDLEARIISSPGPSANLALYDNDSVHAYFWGEDWGEITLYDATGDGTVDLTAGLASGGGLYLGKETGTQGMSLLGGTTNSGASLTMRDGGGGIGIYMNAEGLGDATVDLPWGAISAEERLDEPGIASDVSTGFFTHAEVMQDLVTVTITTPADGYIVVEGMCYGLLSGTTSRNSGIVQIDENEGLLPVAPYFTNFAAPAFASTLAYTYPVFVQRVYFKSQGTYTFRMEGMKEQGLSPAAVVQTQNHIIRATYYSTSYGTVNAVVSATEPDMTGELQLVDLRELELRAARTRAEAASAAAEAERAQMELLEARMRGAKARTPQR